MDIGKVLITGGALVIITSLFFYNGGGSVDPAKQRAENNSESFAKSEFKHNMRELESERKTIGEAAYARGYSHEQAVLEYRERIAKNPVSGLCESHSENKGGDVIEHPIPSVCTGIFRIPVLVDGPKKLIVKVEWTTPGGRVITGSPQLVAGYKSIAVPLGGNRWEVEGNVDYRHEHFDDDIKLRVTYE